MPSWRRRTPRQAVEEAGLSVRDGHAVADAGRHHRFPLEHLAQDLAARGPVRGLGSCELLMGGLSRASSEA
jgi:hypothetical protein